MLGTKFGPVLWTAKGNTIGLPVGSPGTLIGLVLGFELGALLIAPFGPVLGPALGNSIDLPLGTHWEWRPGRPDVEGSRSSIGILPTYRGFQDIGSSRALNCSPHSITSCTRYSRLAF
jgi:hypothetical protein